MENPKKLPTYAIVLLCIFYPFGLLYLLFIQIRKLRTQPEEYKKTNTILTAIAAFLIFSGVFYLISGVTGQVEADPDSVLFGIVTMLLVGCGGGIALLIYCHKYKKPGKLYERYAPLLKGYPEPDIAELARLLGVSQEQVVSDVQTMLDVGYLRGIYIDRGRGKLVCPQAKKAEIPKRQVICPHCGGINQVPVETAAVCDYCNMPIGG